MLRDWIDAGVIFGVVILNALVGFVQEAKAVAAIEALAASMTTEATVVRGGETVRLPATEIVPGDLVLLQAGDKVPADLRLVRERELRVDESALTGESIGVEKDVDPVERDSGLGDRRGMAYGSSLVTYGTGAGVVVATGDATEVGKISELIASATELKTPLTRKIAEFSKTLLVIILALGAVTFVVGLVRGESFVDMFKASIALAVAAIPEGLPAVVTITLAIGVSRMARRRAVIRKLPAVEALGSTTVICSDKTGTLTENQMTVQRIVAAGHGYRVTGTGYAPLGEIVAAGALRDDGTMPPEGAEVGDGAAVEGADGGSANGGEGAEAGAAATAGAGLDPVALELLRAGLLCNDSRIVEEDGRWEVRGDPTEGALETVARKAGLDYAAEESRRPRLDAIPFESEHQYMATLHDAGDGRRIVYVKGAVEKVLARCDRTLGGVTPSGGGALVPLDGAAVHGVVDVLAAEGLRVLAFARGELPAGNDTLDHDDVAGGLVFLGLQAMIDPPRPEAIAAVAACRAAGITVKMITGDHAVTAAAIARQIGLTDEENPQALTGAEMAQLHDKELIAAAARSNVFARVTPEQKLRLVEALQATGHVVAMTGDGVNDAPALKQADIGVAMGLAGTDVAKEAADMVLTDDNFASIEAAVEEGRGVFDNLVKFIAYALPTNVGQGLVLLTAVFVGVSLPILPLQILWINMTTAVLLGLGLAFEAKEPGIMERPPRPPGSPILSRAIITRIVFMGLLLLAGAFGLFEWAQAQGYSDEASRTVAVNTFMAVQILYLFNCRSMRRSLFRLNPFGNLAIVGGVAVMVVLQLLFTYAGFMHVAFESAAIEADDWVIIVGVGVAAMLLMEVLGWFQRRVHVL
mgnify:FL=1